MRALCETSFYAPRVEMRGKGLARPRECGFGHIAVGPGQRADFLDARRRCRPPGRTSKHERPSSGTMSRRGGYIEVRAGFFEGSELWDCWSIEGELSIETGGLRSDAKNQETDEKHELG